MVSDARATVTPAKDGRGGFFAVDRRAWHLVAGLGMNPAVAYLVMARGTGGDNRTTKWSTNAVETYTGIARSRAKAAIGALEASGLVLRDPASKRDHPKYKLAPAHEVCGCEGYRHPFPDEEHRRVHAALGNAWWEVPISTGRLSKAFQQWGSENPGRIAEALVRLDLAEQSKNGRQTRVIPFDPEAVSRPEWIWLPNALVDSASAEVSPVELIRQTASPLALRLLVNLYGSQVLDEDGGVHFRHIWKAYVRCQVGQQGALVVWGFVPGHDRASVDAPFVAPHFYTAKDAAAMQAGWAKFWECWNLLRTTELVEFVGHLVTSDDAAGEIVHPVALAGTGLAIEQQLGQAALRAGAAMCTPGQVKWAEAQGVVMLAPVAKHMAQVQMLGIARLRYKPRTLRTMAFMAREGEWRQQLDKLAAFTSPPAEAACNIKEVSRNIKEGSKKI